MKILPFTDTQAGTTVKYNKLMYRHLQLLSMFLHVNQVTDDWEASSVKLTVGIKTLLIMQNVPFQGVRLL